MPEKKIRDDQELERWMRNGLSNKEILQRYRTEGVPAHEMPTGQALSMFRARRGLEPAKPAHRELLPWTVRSDHRGLWAAKMLRTEARRRRGDKLPWKQVEYLDNWLARLAEDDLVVHYDPDTEGGWFYVPRRPNIDKDIIREPDERPEDNDRYRMTDEEIHEEIKKLSGRPMFPKQHKQNA